MSESNSWIASIFAKVAEWAIVFVLGLLFRKRVGRFFVKAKKWLFNDFVAIKIVSIQTYTPEDTSVEIREFSKLIYDDVETRITSPQLYDVFNDGMRIAIPEFGILKLILSRIHNEETEDGREQVERIKVTLEPENPIRLGIREVHLLNDYISVAEVLFSASAGLILTPKRSLQNYTILELPRSGIFVEEKTFEIDDEDLGTHVHATANKLTLTVKPTSNIAKATSKYILA